jgi:hypothetical protein
VSLTLSPQMKIVALVGVILILALGGGSMLLGRSQPAPVIVATPPLKQVQPATKKAPTPAAVKHAAAPAKHTPTAHKQVAAKPKAPAVPRVAANGLPGALDMLLHGHRVVVVALWDPEIPSDKFAFLEAEAGAQAANAGFLAVNVLDERVSAPLTALVGGGSVLPSPGVLVYKQPSTLMNRFDGFADRDAIAEAVANALLADTPPPGAVPAATAPAATATIPATTTPAP